MSSVGDQYPIDHVRERGYGKVDIDQSEEEIDDIDIDVEYEGEDEFETSSSGRNYVLWGLRRTLEFGLLNRSK